MPLIFFREEGVSRLSSSRPPRSSERRFGRGGRGCLCSLPGGQQGTEPEAGPGRPQPRRSAAADGAAVGLRCPPEGAGRPPRRFSQPPRRLGSVAGWCPAEGDFGPATKQRGAVNGGCRPSPCPLRLCWAAGAPVFLRVVTGISDCSCSRGEVSSLTR